jgi:hypothetical protein
MQKLGSSGLSTRRILILCNAERYRAAPVSGGHGRRRKCRHSRTHGRAITAHVAGSPKTGRKTHHPIWFLIFFSIYASLKQEQMTA